mmetsp:Transcript_17181/g.50756  ORF Transcript_17181/g.50756 Transcript_17181/m.50756 type:complete len:850 (-) Transcript_17181:119-2668(-)
MSDTSDPAREVPPQLDLKPPPDQDQEGDPKGDVVDMQTVKPPTPKHFEGPFARSCPACTYKCAPDVVRCTMCSVPLPPQKNSPFVFSAGAYPALERTPSGVAVSPASTPGCADDLDWWDAGALRRNSAAGADRTKVRRVKSQPLQCNMDAAFLAHLKATAETVFTWKQADYVYTGQHGDYPTFEDVNRNGDRIFFEDGRWYHNGGFGMAKHYSIGCSGASPLPPTGRGWVYCDGLKPAQVAVVYTAHFFSNLQDKHPDLYHRVMADDVFEAQFFDANRPNVEKLARLVELDNIKDFVKKAKDQPFLGPMTDLCLRLGLSIPGPTRNPICKWMGALAYDLPRDSVTKADEIADAVIGHIGQSLLSLTEGGPMVSQPAGSKAEAGAAPTVVEGEAGLDVEFWKSSGRRSAAQGAKEAFLEAYLKRVLCEPLQSLAEHKAVSKLERISEAASGGRGDWWYATALVLPAQQIMEDLLEEQVDAGDNTKLSLVASDTLSADRRIYSINLGKIQKTYDRGFSDLKIEAKGFEKDTLEANHHHKPTQPCRGPMTVFQVKAQAACAYDAFCHVVRSLATRVKAEVKIPSMKSAFRIVQKSVLFALRETGDTSPDCSTITDVNRAMLIATDPDHFLRIIAEIRKEKRIRVRWVKDRLNTPTEGGWADLLVLFEVNGTNRHVGEVQIAFAILHNARAGGEGHAAYVNARHAIELMEAAGGVFYYRPPPGGDGTPDVADSEKDPRGSAVEVHVHAAHHEENVRLRKQVMALRNALHAERKARKDAEKKVLHLQHKLDGAVAAPPPHVPTGGSLPSISPPKGRRKQDRRRTKSPLPKRTNGSLAKGHGHGRTKGTKEEGLP